MPIATCARPAPRSPARRQPPRPASLAGSDERAPRTERGRGTPASRPLAASQRSRALPPTNPEGAVLASARMTARVQVEAGGPEYVTDVAYLRNFVEDLAPPRLRLAAALNGFP